MDLAFRAGHHDLIVPPAVSNAKQRVLSSAQPSTSTTSATEAQREVR